MLPLQPERTIISTQTINYQPQMQYETVFILTPVLSDAQMKEAVEKFAKVLTDNGAEIVNSEEWGLRNRPAFTALSNSKLIPSLSASSKQHTAATSAFSVGSPSVRTSMQHSTPPSVAHAVPHNPKHKP